MVAFGELNMTDKDYYSTTPENLMLRIEGYREAQNRANREAWEQARMIGYWSISPHAKKGLRPTSLVTFPWETEQVKWTLEDWIEFEKMMDKSFSA